MMVTGVRLFTSVLSSSRSTAERPRPVGGGGWSRLGCVASGTAYNVYAGAPANLIHFVLARYSLLPRPTRLPPFRHRFGNFRVDFSRLFLRQLCFAYVILLEKRTVVQQHNQVRFALDHH